MKKLILCISLCSLLLAGCGKASQKTEKTPASSGEEFSTTLPILQEKQDTTNEQFNVLANAEVVAVNSTPPADEIQKGHKIYAANNGVAEKMKMGISRNISVIMMCHLLGQLMQKILRMRRSLQSTMLKRGEAITWFNSIISMLLISLHWKTVAI